MPSLPHIRLPPEVLPADGRFGSGPSKVRSEAVLELTRRTMELLMGYGWPGNQPHDQDSERGCPADGSVPDVNQVLSAQQA